MKILKIEFQNFKSYGNKKVTLNIEKDFNNDLTLLTGANGFGKCLSPDTKIDIRFKNKELEKQFKLFLKNKQF